MYLLLIVFGLTCVSDFFLAKSLDKEKDDDSREEYNPNKTWAIISVVVFGVWQAARLFSPFIGDIIGCILIGAYVVIHFIIRWSRGTSGDDGLAILGIGLLFGFPTVSILLILARVFLA